MNTSERSPTKSQNDLNGAAKSSTHFLRGKGSASGNVKKFDNQIPKNPSKSALRSGLRSATPEIPLELSADEPIHMVLKKYREI
jgi:hypothetical protein